MGTLSFRMAMSELHMVWPVACTPVERAVNPLSRGDTALLAETALRIVGGPD